MSMYRAGTVSIANGSRQLNGAGTQWVRNVIRGEMWRSPTGFLCEIDAVVSDTIIMLAEDYTGNALSGVPYLIVPTEANDAEVAAALSQLIQQYSGVVTGIGTGSFPGGTTATPGFRFVNDQDTGLTNPAANTLGIVTGGVEAIRADPNGARVRGGLTIAGFGNGTTADGLILNRSTGGNAYGIYPNANDLVVRSITAGIDIATFAYGGNVGIGTSSPTSGYRTTIVGAAGGGVLHLKGNGTNKGSPGLYVTDGSVELCAGADGGNGHAFFGTFGGYPVVFNTGNAERARIDMAGNISIGSTVAGPFRLRIVSADASNLAVHNSAGNGNRITFSDQSWEGSIGHISGNLTFQAGGQVERARIDASGNLLVGATGGDHHVINKVNAANGSPLLSVTQDGGETVVARFYHINAAVATGANAAAAAFKVGHPSTGRSISATGTINASGADLAEYKRKAAGCGTIAKGDVCGVTAGNELTKKWSEAIDFVIKTHRPHVVGGDTWGTADSVTPDGERIGEEPQKPAEPAQPAPIAIPEPLAPLDGDRPALFADAEPEWTGGDEPALPDAPTLVDNPLPGADASDDDVALWAERDAQNRFAQLRYLAAMQPVEDWRAARAAFAAAHVAWHAHAAATAAREAEIAAAVEAQQTTDRDHAAAVEQFESDMAEFNREYSAWKARHEAARANVDRIAMNGQVPVNVTGPFAPGDFVVAMPNGSGIKAVAFSPADFLALDPLVQLRKVARVWGVTEEFREVVDGVETVVWPAGLAWCIVSVG